MVLCVPNVQKASFCSLKVNCIGNFIEGSILNNEAVRNYPCSALKTEHERQMVEKDGQFENVRADLETRLNQAKEEYDARVEDLLGEHQAQLDAHRRSHDEAVRNLEHQKGTIISGLERAEISRVNCSATQYATFLFRRTLHALIVNASFFIHPHSDLGDNIGGLVNPL